MSSPTTTPAPLSPPPPPVVPLTDQDLLPPSDQMEPSAKSRARDRLSLMRALSHLPSSSSSSSSSPSASLLGRHGRSHSTPGLYAGRASTLSSASISSVLGSSPFTPTSPTSLLDESTSTTVPGTPPSRLLDGSDLAQKLKSSTFNPWPMLPLELKIHIFSFLSPRQLVSAARTSRDFHRTCFDGQLWTTFNASAFYKQISADSLAKMLVSAGLFVQHLDLRGCVQVELHKRTEVVFEACRNLLSLTVEGLLNLQRESLHSLLHANQRLIRLNLTASSAVTNITCDIIAESCPQLESLNVSWCAYMDARGIMRIIEGCPRLTDLRAGHVRGFNNRDVASVIFKSNKLTRLSLPNCDQLDDAALRIMLHGSNPEIDIVTGIPVTAPRRFRHLNFSRCARITPNGFAALAHVVPDLESLELGSCPGVTDTSMGLILATMPRLTHLDIENGQQLTNRFLTDHFAKAPCTSTLLHLTISHCDNLGDAGMLPFLRACKALQVLEMDNTRISDLVLAEVAALVRRRSLASTALKPEPGNHRPLVTLRIVAYDCQHVTWTGVRGVLSHNAEMIVPKRSEVQDSMDSVASESSDGSNSPEVMEGFANRLVEGDIAQKQQRPSLFPYPVEVISLNVFCSWQMTVDEHTKRVLRGDLASAARLERKWAEWMRLGEAGGDTAEARRRARRAREAQLRGEDDDGGLIGGRRRARTAVCAVM